MFTTDLSLKASTRSTNRSPSASWRTRGIRRCLRPRVVQADPPRHGTRSPARPRGPDEPIWQDPVPEVDHELIDDAGRSPTSRGTLLAPGCPCRLVSTAWASASTYRDSDMRGGANGARIRWPRRKTGRSTSRSKLTDTLDTLERIPQRVQRLAVPRTKRSRWPT